MHKSKEYEEGVDANYNKVTPNVWENLFDSMASTDTRFLEIINEHDIRRLPRSKTFGAHNMNKMMQEIEKTVNDYTIEYSLCSTPIHYLLSLDASLPGLDE